MTWTQFWSQASVSIPGGYFHNTPRVVYDGTVQRWFAAESMNDPNNPKAEYHFLLAVSVGADPTGAWNGFAILGNPGGNNDAYWAALGLDAQGVYLSALVQDYDTGAAMGCTLLALPKTDLLMIPPVITNRTWFGLLSTNYGQAFKPVICLDGSAGGDVLATGGFGFDPITGASVTNDMLVAFAVHNAGGPGPATIGAPAIHSVPDYTAPANAFQPDGSSNLVDGDSEFYANAYRVGGVLFAVQGVQVGAHPAVRWYRISATDDSILESGTLSDPSLDLYYPSIAANTNGTVVIAFNGSGANTYVSCFAAVGQTVKGVTTFGNPLLLKSGVASYQNLDFQGDNAWGWFSTTCVDPADPNTFWTINAFAAGPATWATQITQILTSPSPGLSIGKSGPDLLLSWPVTDVPFQLESAPRLAAGPAWSPVMQLATTNGAIVSVLVPATNSTAFFRLVESQ